jgi:hypothetical protein
VHGRNWHDPSYQVETDGNEADAYRFGTIVLLMHHPIVIERRRADGLANLPTFSQAALDPAATQY